MAPVVPAFAAAPAAAMPPTVAAPVPTRPVPAARVPAMAVTTKAVLHVLQLRGTEFVGRLTQIQVLGRHRKSGGGNRRGRNAGQEKFTHCVPPFPKPRSAAPKARPPTRTSPPERTATTGFGS